MYQPAVNLTKPMNRLREHRSQLHQQGRTRTDDAKEDLGLSEPARGLVPILEHLEHGGHLPARIHRLVLDDHELLLRRTIDLDDAVQRVGRVGRDDVEPRPVLVQYELVARQIGRRRARGAAPARHRTGL